MIQFKLFKESLLAPLLTLSAALDKKQPLPILSHVHMRLLPNELIMTATDLEIEITAHIECITQCEDVSITVAAKKLLDIVRSLDDGTQPELVYHDGTMSIKEGRSHFKLATLPAADYPKMQEDINEVEMTIPKLAFTRLLQRTHFSMSCQDVRVFLNALCLECHEAGLTAVATDGHRMSIVQYGFQFEGEKQRWLIPRKAVLDMLRLLQGIDDDAITFLASGHHVKLVTQQYAFSSKLVDAKFPPYTKAIPQHQDRVVEVDRDRLKRALSRIVILAHEKSRAILLQVEPDALTLIANNQDREEAVETLETKLDGEPIKIGVNASYLLEVLNVMPEGQIQLSFAHPDSSILVESTQDPQFQYIIMPMKI